MLPHTSSIDKPSYLRANNKIIQDSYSLIYNKMENFCGNNFDTLLAADYGILEKVVSETFRYSRPTSMARGLYCTILQVCITLYIKINSPINNFLQKYLLPIIIIYNLSQNICFISMKKPMSFMNGRN